MSVPDPTRITLCGPLAVEIGGCRVDGALPGRQGRLVVAYLAARRERPVDRGELIEALWPGDPPGDPEETLSALLSKVRRAVGPGLIDGRRELTLRLPPAAEIDLEQAAAAADRAEAALARSDWREAWSAAGETLDVTGRGFLTGLDGAWVDEGRREVEDLRLRALEVAASAGAELGGPELAAGERAARALIDAAPFRESGHRSLMTALAARGNVAEALQVYEELRIRLREELGAVPGAALQALHERLLGQGAARPAAEPPPPPAGPREERKLVTVLFAELADPALDPELARRELAPYRDRVRAEIDRFGGTVDHFDGGALLAVFGAPVAHEDDPERAVRAALRLLEIARELGAGAPRAAIATGEALVGLAGGPLAHGHLGGVALGLLRAAGPGEAVVDEATARATRDAIEYGGTEGSRRARDVRRRPPAGPALTPLVGRDHELALLERLHRTVVEEGRPRLVAIVGEPGVGKTRLTEELIGRELGGGAVYRGRCLPYGEGITYWALREILWSAAGIALDDGAAAARQKLRSLVRGLIPEPDEAERTAAALARTAGIAIENGTLDGMAPESVAEELGLAWPRLLGALALERPTVVVVEDLHWAEAPLLDTLERLVSRASGPLLVVATARPEFAGTRPSWSAATGMSQLGLEPLTEDQSRQLVEGLLPGVSPALRDRLAGPAEGNPFFAEEIVRHVSARAHDDRTPVAGVPIPDSVRALIAAGIDALPDAEKRTLHDAAVVGRVFWATTLEAMGGGAAVRPALRALEEKGLVKASPSSVLPGQLELSFRHALKREVAYRSIPRARRCRAHAGVARWIDELAGERRSEFVDLLAYHYEAAAAAEDAALAWADAPHEREPLRAAAVEALLEAGEVARRRLAVRQAVRFADRALALGAAGAERLAALELRASALHAAVRSDEAFAAYRAAIELALELGDDTALWRLRAHAALLCSRYSGAFTSVAWREPAVRLVEEALAEIGEDNVSFEAGALLVARSAIGSRWFDELEGRDAEAERDARRAIEIGEAIGSPYLLSHAVEALVEHAGRAGFCDGAALGERLLAVCESMSDRVGAHEGLVTAAISLARAGRHERAREAARTATRESARLSAHHATHAAAGEAICLAPAGRFEELLDVTRRVPEVVRAEGGRLCQMGALGLAAHTLALHERGEAGAAQEALELFRAAPPARGLVPFSCLAIEMLRPVAGIEHCCGAAEDCGQVRATVTGRLYDLRLQLQLTALRPDRDALADLVARARELAGPACAPPIAWIADWAEAVQTARDGDAPEAVARARTATEALAGYGEPYTAARLLVDLLPFLPEDLAEPLAGDVARRLDAMGARSSAAEARAGGRVST